MLFRHIKEMLMKFKLKYFLGILFIIACDALQLFTPGVLGRLVSDINHNTLTKDKINHYIFLVLILAVGVAVFRYLWRKTIIAASRQLEYEIRKKFFGHLETLSVSYYHQHTTGSLMAHATNDINAIRASFGQGIIMIVDASFLTVMTIYAMLVNTNIQLTILALIPMPFIAVATFTLGGKLQKRFKKVQESFEDITTISQEAFSGIRVIKSFAREEEQNEAFAKVNDKNLQANMSLVKLFGFMFPIITFISTISLIVAITVGGIMVVNNTLELGKYTEFTLYLGLLTWPFMALGWVVNVLQRGIASLKRINEIFDEVPEITNHADAKHIDGLEASIEVRNLSFTYPNTDQAVLENVSFKIEAGKTLAIIGETGAGKTTIANLLLRLYEAPHDSIFVGGQAINTLTLDQLRSWVGYVPQDNFLFSTKISDNIAFSNPDLTRAEVEAASRVSHVYKEILDFPDGFDTLLGEKGINLSGGQKQRISIARAIAEDPKILILDDSLSAVDTKTEDSILRYLNEEIKDKTSIIIAHRISTIKHADEIILLNDTKIAERGNHESLMALGGLYSDLYKKQLLEEKVNED